MPFMSFVIGLFRKFSKVEGGVRYVFPGLRRQIRCQAEGKNEKKWIQLKAFGVSFAEGPKKQPWSDMAKCLLAQTLCCRRIHPRIPQM
jgi:hypothetical protein